MQKHASFFLTFIIAITARVAADELQFNRDIRPILSDTCYQCHGPDAKVRATDLRLDVQSSAFGPLDEGRRAIVAAKPAESDLIRRIASTDPDVQMPPPKSGRKLTPQQIETLRRWIEQGAKWQGHWAFIAPQRPALPPIRNPQSPIRNPIDHFVLSRLEQMGIAPSRETAKETLLRRVTLDLTGLPPTLEELDAFLADKSADAYEQAVDRLLNSPRYGERMVWEWLDAARYADTNGYQGDPTRTMYFWRDWVIAALNQNLPFDRFTVEQLAGDLLPNPTQEQLVATGFHRNHMINGEGGRIAEESRVDYVQDRVETTGTVWLGLTFNCCRCHDHKFDPFTQREYYQLAAYFNSIDESGANDAGGLANPVISLATPEQQQRIAEFRAKENDANKSRDEREKQLRDGLAEWEKLLAASAGQTGDAVWQTLAPETQTSEAGATLTKTDDGAILAGGPNPAKDTFVVTYKTALKNITGFRLEALPDKSLVNSGPGRADNGNFVLTEFKVRRGEQPVALAAIKADYSQAGFSPADAVDGKDETGWAIASEFGKPHSAFFAVRGPAGDAAADTLSVRFEFKSPHISHVVGKFRLSVTEAAPELLQSPPNDIVEILRKPADQRNDAEKKKLFEHRRDTDAGFAAAKKRADDAKREREGVERSSPRTMVMRERSQPRDTFILVRGAYDKFADKVSHGVPTVLPLLPKEFANNRLALARWLVAPEHPLTARVTVNRYWQTFFGLGLVKTAEDFGVQGENPSHPELLDWLACELQQPTVPQPSVVNSHPNNAWNVKHIHRLIVTSATYRQSSKTTPDAAARDPENRLLSRGPRYRLPSWMIRDQALAASGLLVEKLGGPPVKGYQPPGIWEEATFGQIRYEPEHGDALYRRSLYQFWRRIVGPTMFFDVASRQTCQVKTSRTNTPLHALATLNDVTYVEAARALAQRVLLSPAPDDATRITAAFRRCTSRSPSPAELAVLTRRLQSLRDQYAQNPDAAKKLIATGESKPDEKLNPVELAAMTGVTTVLLNLDETISKE